jgi:hypothetical protein
MAGDAKYVDRLLVHRRRRSGESRRRRLLWGLEIGASVLVLAAATGALVDWSSVMQAVFKLAG